MNATKGTPDAQGYLSSGPKGVGSRALMTAGKAMDNAQDSLHWALNSVKGARGKELLNELPHAEKALTEARLAFTPLIATVANRGHAVEYARLECIRESLTGAEATITWAQEQCAALRQQKPIRILHSFPTSNSDNEVHN